LFSFFEAYFLNYIEGTKFIIEDAKKIVDTGVAIPKRIKDSHDILGTFQIVSNSHEMSITPATYLPKTEIFGTDAVTECLENMIEEIKKPSTLEHQHRHTIDIASKRRQYQNHPQTGGEVRETGEGTV
jgi:hypothetical protein